MEQKKSIKLENHIYPEGIFTPKDMIDYVCAVYGIDKPDLLISTIKEICSQSQGVEYYGWFDDYFDEWILQDTYK
jgi:hypothetical protein